MTSQTSSHGSLDGLAADLATSPYKPVRFLARGGMGEVVVVQHRELGRNVVMKLLLSKLEGQEQLAERMRAEARLLARLSHPSLVSVVDSGRTSTGRPYIVTELLEGETLGDHLNTRGGHLPVREALDLALQALAGLAIVHDAGFVHRDLKPANLFVVKAGESGRRRLKILDFGIAKALSEDDRRALGLFAPTTEGAIMGTPSSVSPEQVQSGKVDARTDLYGLGVVLFRVLTGRPPFVGDALALFRAHLLEVPPVPSTVAPQPIPAAIDRILLKALEKEPSKRFQNAAEMQAAIEHALSDLDLATDGPAGRVHTDAPTLEATFVPHQLGALANATATPSSAIHEEDTTTHQAAPDGSARPAATSAGPAAFAPRPDEASGSRLAPHPREVAAPATAVLPTVDAARRFVPAAPPRKTEMLRVAAQNAPKDTVRLDAPEPLDSPWRAVPSKGREGATARRAGAAARRPAPPPPTWLATWGPIFVALIASALVLLALFVWRAP